MDADAAAEAVNIYKNDYLGIIKADSDVQEKVGKALEEKLKKAGINP